MANLRSTLNTISGTDIGGKEFTLEDTDVQQYIDNPDMAELEAQVTKARYGGSSINDPSPSDPQQASSASGPGVGQPQNVDFSRRGDFEKHVFNQLKNENMPDGNPFNFNPTAGLNQISKEDLPQLFENIFQREVAWDDRHLLDDDQKKFWMTEVKRFRAHVKDALTSERAAAVDQYNQMMNSFDNAAKEQAAAAKLKREKSKHIMEVKGKARERGDKRKKGYQEALSSRTDLLTKERELIAEFLEAETAGTLTPEESTARLAELKSMREERTVIDADIKSQQIPKPKSGITKVKATPGEKSPKESETDADGKTIVRKKVPKRDGDKKTVVARGVMKKGPNKGRKVVKYSDGSMAYADEIK